MEEEEDRGKSGCAAGEKNRKNGEAEVAWARRTMLAVRERSFNNPDLPFIREVMENGGEKR